MNEVQTADINKMEDPLTLAQNISDFYIYITFYILKKNSK